MNEHPEKTRKYAMIGAIVGLVFGLALGGFGVWLSVSEVQPMIGMLLLSMGLPGCLLVGACVGIAIGSRDS